MRGWAIVISLLGSSLGEPLEVQRAAHPSASVAELAPSPYVGGYELPSTGASAPVLAPRSALPRSALGASSRPALAPSPYELAPLTELAPNPYAPTAWLAPDPYVDRRALGQAPPLMSVSHERLASRRRAAGARSRPALAPSPYELAPLTDLAPNPY